VNSSAEDREELNRAEVTDEDQKNFQKWYKKAQKRYHAGKGMRDRPEGLRGDHSSIIRGSVAASKELHESVPLALAALVLHGRAEDDPLGYLRPWVGSDQRLAELAVDGLNNEGDSVRRLAVFGLWCEHDGCHRFIRPVAVKMKSAPHSFFVSAVCATCQDVTVIWADEGGVWVRSAPDLKKKQHPMRPQDLYNWVQRERPPTNRRARLITP
jgi:hypothetical protein